MQEKIKRMLEFAKCGIHHNYANTDKLPELLKTLDEVTKHLIDTDIE